MAVKLTINTLTPGAVTRNRTRDLNLTTGELFQLSYDGKYWHTPKDLNLQPADLEAAALPIELEIHNWWIGLESNQVGCKPNALQALPAPYGSMHPNTGCGEWI